MKFIFVTILLLIAFQSNYSQMRVIYGIKQDGKEVNNDSVVLYISQYSARISRPALNKESQYFDFSNKQTVQTLSGEGLSLFAFRKNYEEKVQPVTSLLENIEGYQCMKTGMKIRSNNIEVWFTEKSGYKGGPGLYLSEIPGLVLKIIRNGNYEIFAKQIDTSDGYITESLIPYQNVTDIDESEFQQRLIESRYKTFSIFENEILNFNDSLQKDYGREIVRFAKGTIVARKVKLPEASAHSIVMAEITVQSNGDAYDRTGSVFAIPVNGKSNFLDGLKNGVESLPKYNEGKWRGITLTDEYIPPLELVRFITSFGAGYFGKDIKIKGNNWKDSITYRQDVSEIIKGTNREVWIGAYIGNWDKGGHKISLRLKYFEENEYENNVKWIMPVFSTLNLMEMEGQEYGNIFRNDTLKAKVSIPEGLKNLRLRFITTGHGNDEFIPRQHRVYFDGKEIFKVIPWRTDCGTFRDNNPASGNFLNGMSSSDYSRSNWCPGMVVNPYDIRLDEVIPGQHEIKVAIECGENSYWNVTGCLLGE